MHPQLLKSAEKKSCAFIILGCQRESSETAFALAGLHGTEKGLLQGPLCSLHPKLSERDKIKKSCFLEEAVQFLMLLINPRYLGKAEGSGFFPSLADLLQIVSFV